MRYFSTFTGIGGFELGIINAYENLFSEETEERARKESPQTLREQTDESTDEGHAGLGSGGAGTQQHADLGSLGQSPVCVGYSEIDRYASSIYKRHFPNHINYGDITLINEKELPDFDLLVGGFPCQAFSIAGKRAGFNDTRGTLFFDLARILKEKQPRLFVFENVKGLLSHDGGRTFKTIVATITELGYDCQWQVLNSKNHGVPQNRERIIIVGHLRGTPRPEVFPFGHDSKEADGISGQHSNTLTTRYYGGQANGTYVIESELDAQEIKQVNNPIHSNDRMYDGLKIRRLTPTECERLQAFPDGWTKYGYGDIEISDTHRYKTLGNAVTTNVIRNVMERIFASI